MSLNISDLHLKVKKIAKLKSYLSPIDFENIIHASMIKKIKMILICHY